MNHDVQDLFDSGPCRLRGGRYWYGRYRGIVFKVQVFRTTSPGRRGHWNCWAGYIYLDQRMASEAVWDTLRRERALNDLLDHPNGGLTFFESSNATDYKTGLVYEKIEAGWDHNHSWDLERAGYAGAQPDGGHVAVIARCAIDYLARELPDLLVFNQHDGSRARIGDARPDDPFYTDLAPVDPKQRRHFVDAMAPVNPTT